MIKTPSPAPKAKKSPAKADDGADRIAKVIARAGLCSRREAEAWIAPFAAALQMSAMIYLVGATFQGIAYQPVMLMLVGLQIGLNTYCLRIDSARTILARSASRKTVCTVASSVCAAALNNWRAFSRLALRAPKS